jgi:hypothetical protein
MKEKISLVLFLQFGIWFYAQSNINLKEISFLRTDSIINIDKYEQEISKDLEKIDKNFEMLDYSGSEKEKSNIINSISNDDLKQYQQVFHYKSVNDSIIQRYETKKNGDILSGDIYINTKNAREYYDFPYPKNDISFKFRFKKIKDLKIREFRKETQTVNGIKCFKILVSYTEIIDAKTNVEFPEFNTKEEQNHIFLEMWVSENIKTIFHPVFKIREILEKYYPLEIIEVEKEYQRKYILWNLKI